MRVSRTLKVVETREQGQESRTTRKLRNPNNCHTLTVAFSEILANYEVDTFVRADASRLVVLVDSEALGTISHFTAATLRQHETPLRLALMDRALADGFEAARFLGSFRHSHWQSLQLQPTTRERRMRPAPSGSLPPAF